MDYGWVALPQLKTSHRGRFFNLSAGPWPEKPTPGISFVSLVPGIGPLALGNGLARAVLGLLALFNKSVEYSFKLLSFTGNLGSTSL